jgi:hypothetical protein
MVNLGGMRLMIFRKNITLPVVTEGLREPPGGPVGVRSTERSEPRKVATPKGARPNYN